MVALVAVFGGGQHASFSTYNIRTMMVYVKVHGGVRIDSKIRIKGEAVFWLSLQYSYLCPNSKPLLRIKYILIGGDGL